MEGPELCKSVFVCHWDGLSLMCLSFAQFLVLMVQGIRETQTEVIVMGVGEAIMDVLIALTAELWAAKIKAEVTCCTSRNLSKQVPKFAVSWVS